MKKAILIILLLFLAICSITYSQDSIILREISMLSEHINFNKLSNIKQIKQIENNKDWLDPNFIVNFNKDNSVRSLICISRDTAFFRFLFLTNNFNRITKNHIELKEIISKLPNDYEYILKPKLFNKDSILNNKIKEYDTIYTKEDTSNSIVSFYRFNDTLIIFHKDSNFINDTTLIIFKDNKLFKRLKYRDNQFMFGIRNGDIDESIFIYDQTDRIICKILNIYKKYYNPYSIGLRSTDTLSYIYKDNGNIIYETRKHKGTYRKDKNTTYFLTYNIHKNDSTIYTKYYEANEKFKPKKLISEEYKVYNKQGLVVKERYIEVSHILGFKKRNLNSNRTFEYTYWEL